jgi:hypothetical protein
MSDLQQRWKGLLGTNPNPPCQHSLWEETGLPGENPRLSECVFSHRCHKSAARIEPTISEMKAACSDDSCVQHSPVRNEVQTYLRPWICDPFHPTAP